MQNANPVPTSDITINEGCLLSCFVFMVYVLLTIKINLSLHKAAADQVGLCSDQQSVLTVKQLRARVFLSSLGVSGTLCLFFYSHKHQVLFDMSRNDSHPHSCHSALSLPAPIMYQPSPALIALRPLKQK